jgi:inosine/xanthosine triphosphate pyrophosphatase family protein
MIRRSVLLATSNPAKREMLAWLLDGLGLALETPETAGTSADVEESDPTHKGNAVRKAIAWSLAYAGTVIASDGGLLIDALGPGWNSVLTARFAGPGVDDRGRLDSLLDLMSPYSGEERRATWLEAVAVARVGELLGVWEAQGGEGFLADSYDVQELVPGFWVGAVWHFPTLGKRYNQLSGAERREVGEPWSLLRPPVRAFFRGWPGPGASV